MGCLNCFKSKVRDDAIGPNKLRENLSAKATDENTNEKSLVPKTSNEPSVEEVEHSRDRTRESHPNESWANSAVITRDFGALATDPSRTSKHTSPSRSPQAANGPNEKIRSELDATPARTVPDCPLSLSEGTRPPRSTSLGSRSRSRSRSRSSRPHNSPSARLSPSKENLRIDASTTSTNQKVSEATAATQLGGTAGDTPTSSAKAKEVTGGSQSPVKEPSLDARGPHPNSLQATTEKGGATSDDKVAAIIPLPESPSSPASPTLPSLSTSVPSVSEKKSPSSLSPPLIDDSNIRRSSQDSDSCLPTDFQAEKDKLMDASRTDKNQTQTTQKLASPKSPPLIIPQAHSSTRPVQQNILIDAPTPTSASSATRPDNLLRMSTAPSATPPSPNTKTDKRKSRLSRFMSTGGVNKRKSQAMPAAKDLKTMEDMPPTPKYVSTAVASEKNQVRDVTLDEKEMQKKEVELETPATVDSVTGRAWKDDGDNDSLFCY